MRVVVSISKAMNKKKKKKSDKKRVWGLRFGEFYYGAEFPHKDFFDSKRYDVDMKGIQGDVEVS